MRRIQNLAYVGIIAGAVAVGAVVVFTAAHLPIGYDVPHTIPSAPSPLPMAAEPLNACKTNLQGYLNGADDNCPPDFNNALEELISALQGAIARFRNIADARRGGEDWGWRGPPRGC